jgi:hypothetical protein
MPFSMVQYVFVIHYFLWACSKGQVYKSNPQTLAELKDSVVEFFKISGTTLHRVSTSMMVWVELCLRQGRGHFQCVL